MEDWMRQGVYRLLDLLHQDADQDIINWDSKDKEFVKYYSKASKHRIKVAVLDCGVTDHGYLHQRGQLQHAGQVFYCQAKKLEDHGAHGTFVAGRAGWGTSAIDILDVPIGFNHGVLTNDMFQVHKAMQWAIDHGATIICCAAALSYDSEYIVDGSPTTLAKYIESRPNILFVLTSANENGPVLAAQESHIRPQRGRRFPPKYSHVLCVGGCTREGQLHWWSMFGDIDVWAPSGHFAQFRPIKANLYGGGGPKETRQGTRYGVKLVAIDEWDPRGAIDDSNYRLDTGVSFAVPMVANVAAKVKLLDTGLKAKEVAQIIRDTARITQESIDYKASFSISSPPKILQGPTKVLMLDPSAAYQEANKSGTGKSRSKRIGLAVAGILVLAAGTGVLADYIQKSKET